MEEAASSSRQPLGSRKAKINVPIGYRFKPRDDQLIVHYLKPKAYNQPLPPNTIEDVELYSYSPEALTRNFFVSPFYSVSMLDNWVLCKVYNKKQGKNQDGETSGRGTTADEDEGEDDGDGGAPPSKEEEEEEQQSSSITNAASPQIAVDQKQNHQHYNNMMMLLQSSYPPEMPYYSNNGYDNGASTFGFSDFSGCLGLGQDLACYGNFVPKSSILPPPDPDQFDPTGSKYPLNMMITDPSFTDDERNYLLELLEKLNTNNSFNNGLEDKNTNKRL
ncbi:No apical meristem (NAM) protein [Corchorus capsularis]|uniref:No apical meristem (NAM) protein n=1 Tax=Corchorus capsularis TaxID=210143 RepID=A0A1R3HRP4_COCAP|nr:No apical meristem (NAM) protein [Corchorus capsularis]